MRLIDADAFLEEARSRIDMQDVYLPIHIKELVIDEMPTIDAEPVRHGHWELIGGYRYIGGYGYQYRCSNCIKCADHRTNYCSFCGAKVDEVEE